MNSATWGLFTLWVVVMLLTPALKKRWNSLGLRIGLSVTVLLQGLTSVACVAPSWSLVELLWMLVVLLVGGWLAEFVGTKTGLPFGAYKYTQLLRPRLGGVPFFVPIAYVGVVLPSWGVADLLTGGSRGGGFVATSAVVATAWDLLLDPLMVRWRAWVWGRPVGYFGVPITNFLGWLLVTALLTLAVQPGHIDAAPLATMYVLAWLLYVIGLSIWQLHGPAVTGGLVMGVLAGLAWINAIK